VDPINETLILQHDWRKQTENQAHARRIWLVKATLWWQTKQRIRSKINSKTSAGPVTKRRRVEKSMAITQIFQAVVDK
jgi:hypothetical protein